MLPEEIISPVPLSPNGAGGEHLMSLPLRDAREIFEREYLLAQVNRFGGNISRTAEFVGMERSALHRKLRALGVNSNERSAGLTLEVGQGSLVNQPSCWIAYQSRLMRQAGRAGNNSGNIRRGVSVDQRDGEAHGDRARAKSLQDTFLNHVRKNKTPLTIFLVNGVKLQGVVTWFDNFCVLLRRDGHSQLVYKHAISTIMPGQPIQLADITEAEGAAE